MLIRPLTGLSRGHRAPRVPGDLQDDERDDEADDRIASAEPEGDDDGARDDAERHEAVDTGVVAVGRECRTRKTTACTKSHLRRDLVADEADHSGGCEHPEVRQLLRVKEAPNRLVEGDAR